MSREEWRAFISEGTRTAMVAVTRKDGRPHVLPVWIVLDGDDVLFTTGETTVKGRALQRDDRLALCVDDPTPPYSFVKIDGRARLSRDLDQLRHWATVIGGRYMGAARAEEYGARNAVPGELLVRVTPEHVLSVKGVAD
jgi:PPOX class probable F420-dependent enzyme